MANLPPVKIGALGLGTVGSGTLNVLRRNAGEITRRAGRSIEVEFTGDASRCRTVIVDEGPGYDPDSVPDPTADENLTVASGRGLTLIRAFMTEVTVVAPGNRLEMTYVRPGE
mgnify:CR=1 FL=1